MKSELPRIRPCDAGIPESALLAFLDAVESQDLGLHSFQLVRHGAVVAEAVWEPFHADAPHVLYSLSKSFTSTAIGFAVQEGLLTVEDRVVSFFLDKLPAPPCAGMADMRVRHLLTMSTGHSKEPDIFTDDDWVAAFLRSYVDLAPASRFVYNTPATYMLSAILQRVSGQTTLDYLAPRLFAPLGIEDAKWQTCPMGISTGGFGLTLRIGDIAKFGQFLLQRGTWEGRRLLSAEWIDAATSWQVANDGGKDWSQGYGYQFWRCVPEGVYRGDGAFGQYCVVLPDQDAVFVANSATNDMQAILSAVWSTLLPAMGDPAVPDPAASRALSARSAALSLPGPAGKSGSPLAAKVSGQRYRFGENAFHAREISLRFGVETEVSFRTDTGAFTLPVGQGNWREGTIVDPEAKDARETHVARYHTKVACTGAWTADDTYELRMVYLQSPTQDRLLFHFEAHGVVVEYVRRFAFTTPSQVWTGILLDG